MLQRSYPSSSTAEIADSLGRSLGSGRWDGARLRQLGDLLPMPSTWQQYLLACIGLTVVLGGMLLHVLLSVQIAAADFELRQLRAESAAIERRNSELVYQIAQRSSLAQMATLAAAQGYVPATSRTYVLRSHTPLASLHAENEGPAAGGANGQDEITPDAPVQSPATFEQAAQWWHELQQSAGTATMRLWQELRGWEPRTDGMR